MCFHESGERRKTPVEPLAQVAITFNKRSYRFECGEADVERLEAVANYLKVKLDLLMREHGQAGDERMVLMAALMIADELFDARADIDELLEDGTEKLKAVSENAKSSKDNSRSDSGRKTGS
jgi:cell division protein ZapA